MKRKIHYLLLILFVFSVASYSQKNDVGEANNTIKEFKEKDPGMSKFFSSAYGYAVFPGIGKGGLGVGGAGGKGTLFKSNAAVADSYNEFVAGSYEFAAQVSAVALASGASADAKYQDGIMVVTMAIGGLMYEASVGGQKFKVEEF